MDPKLGEPHFAFVVVSFFLQTCSHSYLIAHKTAFGFYGHRLNMYRKVQPHTGFQILLELAKAKNNNYFVFTSNVDGQASSISPLLDCRPFVC